MVNHAGLRDLGDVWQVTSAVHAEQSHATFPSECLEVVRFEVAVKAVSLIDLRPSQTSVPILAGLVIAFDVFFELLLVLEDQQVYLRIKVKESICHCNQRDTKELDWHRAILNSFWLVWYTEYIEDSLDS